MLLVVMVLRWVWAQIYLLPKSFTVGGTLRLDPARGGRLLLPEKSPAGWTHSKSPPSCKKLARTRWIFPGGGGGGECASER